MRSENGYGLKRLGLKMSLKKDVSSSEIGLGFEDQDAKKIQ